METTRLSLLISYSRTTVMMAAGFILLSSPRQYLVNRCLVSLSSSAKANYSKYADAPRSVPTRHSKYALSPVAPMELLREFTDDILNATPGTLFKYSSNGKHLNRVEEYHTSLLVSDATRQKVEYILRGYSFLIPGSIVELQLAHRSTHEDDGFNGRLTKSHVLDDPKQCQGWRNTRSAAHKTQGFIYNMMELIDRIEVEGDMYVELCSKYHGQLAHVYNSCTIFGSSNSGRNLLSGVDDEDSTSTDEEKKDRGIKQTTLSFGSPPGLSTAMFDLVMDAIAVSISLGRIDDPKKAIGMCKQTTQRVLARHSLDLISEKIEHVANKGTNTTITKINANVHSRPTHMTFNALIRAAASARYNGKDDELRDVAIDAAFFAYDAMYNHTGTGVQRNSATYKYMLETVSKFLPISPSRGNIAYTMFYKATFEDAVLDEGILKSLVYGFGNIKDDNGKDFNTWMTKAIISQMSIDKNGHGFPMKWGYNKILRRFHKRLNMY